MKKLTRRYKYFFIAAGMLLAGAVGWGLHLYYKPRASLKNITADATIDAVALYGAYQQDEATADKKFLGKVIAVQGTVQEIQQTDSTLSVELKAGEAGGINCRMVINKLEKVTMPPKGTVISIKGKCSGFLMDVILVDCLLEKN